MKATEIESWALRTIARAQSRQPSEDKRTELKREWTEDYQRAARRIAGHANAAGGEPILWLIGIEETTGVVIGAEHQELSDWMGGIKSQFDGLAPTCHDLNVPTKEGLTVVALVFESNRAPYVVKNPEFGQSKTPISLEVPWREGTSTRSASRADLLLILSEKRSLRALLGELEWNEAVAAREGTDQEQFREQEFHKAMADGSLSELGKEFKDLIIAAYLEISNAQSHKRTLEATSEQRSRMRHSVQIGRTKAMALSAISEALGDLRATVG